jgi:hypothetical protein
MGKQRTVFAALRQHAKSREKPRQHAATCTGNSRRTALTERCGPPPQKAGSGAAADCRAIGLCATLRRRQSDRKASAAGAHRYTARCLCFSRAQRRFAKNRRGAAARLIRHRASQHPAKSMPFGMSGWPLQILYDQITAADKSSARPNPPVGGILASIDDLRATRCSFLGRATGPGRKVK